jgi:hypothetical protein
MKNIEVHDLKGSPLDARQASKLDTPQTYIKQFFSLLKHVLSIFKMRPNIDQMWAPAPQARDRNGLSRGCPSDAHNASHAF